MLQARDIMTKEVLTVTPETPIAELARLIEKRNIGGVPVVDQSGRLAGIVTQSDLVEHVQEMELPPAINILDLHLFLQIPSHLFHKVEKLLGRTVGDIMTPNPITVNADTAAPKIAALMTRHQVHTIPVLEQGKVVGIIGKMDLIRALAQEAGE